jgi:hypothetical protein
MISTKTNKKAVYTTFEPDVQTFGSYAMTVNTTNCLVSPSDSNAKNHLLRPYAEKDYSTKITTLCKGKAAPVTGSGSPQGCEMSRFPHFLDNRLIDGDEVVSFTRRPAGLYPQEDSWYFFLLEAESNPRP